MHRPLAALLLLLLLLQVPSVLMSALVYSSEFQLSDDVVAVRHNFKCYRTERSAKRVNKQAILTHPKQITAKASFKRSAEHVCVLLLQMVCASPAYGYIALQQVITTRGWTILR